MDLNSQTLARFAMPWSRPHQQANHPEVTLFQEDVTQLDPKVLVRMVPRARNADLLVVCAPCQPFSSQNRKRGSVDPRSTLVLQATRFAAVLRPKLILFENVPGLVGTSGVHEILGQTLALKGYSLGRPRRLDAADMGVPQRRIRCVMFAARTEEALERFARADFSTPRKTVRSAIGHLPPLRCGETDPTDPLHHARAHSDVALRRLAAVSRDGGGRECLPPELRLQCHEGNRGFPDVYGRMSWSDVAPTLTTGCTDITRGRFAHPEQDRAISVREAALLQTFPPDYQFRGSRKNIAQLIGNAVPPAMVARMVPALLDSLAVA